MIFYVNIPIRMLTMAEAPGCVREPLKTAIAMGVFWLASVPMVLGAFELVALIRGGQAKPPNSKVISS